MLNKIVKIIGYVVLGLAALVGVLFFVNDAKVLQQGLDAMENMPSDIKILEVEKLAGSWTGLILNSSLVLFVLSAVLAVGFAIYKFIADAINNPKSAIKPAIAIVGAALLVVISYSLASDAIPVFLGADNFDITPATSKWVETSLYGMYILFAISAIVVVI